MNKAFKIKVLTAIWLFIMLPASVSQAQPAPWHNMVFEHIPVVWNQGIPLGNGMTGVLVWQKGNRLRLGIDRADLWDLRPTAEIQKFTYQWAYQHRLSGDWDTVWKVADLPYDRDPGPTKIPGAAIEFDISTLGEVESVVLNISEAVCTIKWKKGVSFSVFVDATTQVCRYAWTGTSITPNLIAPSYSINSSLSNNQDLNESDLPRLGYQQGKIIRSRNMIIYRQKAWGPLQYEAAVRFLQNNNSGEGSFAITSHYSDRAAQPTASSLLEKAASRSFKSALPSHIAWWKKYWQQSSVQVPDTQIEKQYYLEMYKFGASSRKGAPPISLQAVWTADNNRLPPWKGDYHSDLNTQLSYWPAYSSNHLNEASVFTDWLWNNKPYFEKYTRRVFGTEGLNVPGVATLRGHEMGGWHMYALSPTVSCWLAQHFYLQWSYYMDNQFLTKRAYPWVAAAAKHIEQLSTLNDGVRMLPMSSSPEFHDGGMSAWFLRMTNYDRALTRYVFQIAAKMAKASGQKADAAHWLKIMNQLPGLVTDSIEGLTIAPGFPLHESHRHFSHLMAFHPLGLLDYSNAADKVIIDNSLKNLEKNGTSQWTGYSFAWLASIYARAHRGDDALKALKMFASCYCSPNTFHLNNNLCKYAAGSLPNDPFTLEGNFAFASGLQEMLLQSQNDLIRIFPAVPAEWKDLSFNNLRTEGAFLISASKTNGNCDLFTVKAPAGGTASILLPFPTFYISSSKKLISQKSDRGILELKFDPGGSAEIRNGYE